MWVSLQSFILKDPILAAVRFELTTIQSQHKSLTKKPLLQQVVRSWNIQMDDPG